VAIRQQAGHQPVLAAPAASAPLVAPYGLSFAAVHDGPNTLVDDPRIREAIETNYRGLRGKAIALQVMRRSKPLMFQVFSDMVTAVQDGADLLVHAPGFQATASPKRPVCS
jgi:sterol 3beta-glucosyltransferase